MIWPVDVCGGEGVGDGGVVCNLIREERSEVVAVVVKRGS